jgi:anti-sigma regulatory factor (Ser/Thr protein kinase)
LEEEAPVELNLSLPPAVDAPQRARSEAEALALEGRTREDVTLLVSELVTNCVVHADLAPGQNIDLTLSRRDGTVRVEVRDRGRGFAATLVRSDEDDPGSGFGLFIVEQLADRWGIERGAQTCVWFEVDVR